MNRKCAHVSTIITVYAVIVLVTTTLLLPGCVEQHSGERARDIPTALGLASTGIVLSPSLEREGLMKRMSRILAGAGGDYGVYICELDTGDSFGFNQHRPFEAASTVKIPIMMMLYGELEAGNIGRDEVMTYLWSDYEGGTGSIQAQGPGTTWTIGELATRMMKESDNVAKNMLLRRLGYGAVERYAHDQGAGSFDLYNNRITPADMGLLLKRLYSGRVAGPQLTGEMLSLMTGTTDEDRLPRYLSGNISVAHKIGTMDDTIIDVGIVRGAGAPFIICVYSDMVGSEAEAEDIIGRLAWQAAEYEFWRACSEGLFQGPCL
ncbi:hypothetical protein BMS3Abin01_00337 [bacterium BMS3Abin01]|nr:hypothetical protein BMS3Abin01_00337 [bacterium BMS3Abin01]HDZ60047.1 serine hydrolase [Actinomycetota bacterium]